MKGMITRTALALAVAAASLGSAYAFNLFGLFSPDQANNTMETLLSQTPADTILFMGGHSTTESRSIMESWSVTNQSDINELQALLTEIGSENTPALSLFETLLVDYTEVATGGYSALMAHYGLPDKGAGAFYLHGAMPVARFALEDSEAFNKVLNQAILQSGATPVIKQVEDVEVRTWQLVSEGDTERFALAIAVDKGFATVTLFNHTDTAALQSERLGLTDPSDSLAEKGDWDALGDRYDYNETFRGYFDLDGLAATLLTGTQSRLRRDLEALLPEEIEKMDTQMAESRCGPEGYALARQVPRFVFGSELISSTPDSLSQKVGMVLELTNTALTDQLKRLPGSLPAYATDGSDKLLALAVGVDVNVLAPVATALWSQLPQTEYECQALRDITADLRQNTPSMLGMATAMAQGVKGAGVAVYSIETDDSSPVGLAGSVLVTISADNPSALAGLINSNLPGLTGVTLPENGTAVQVPVPRIPQPVFAAIKGKHLVVYTGDAARAPADAMASEPLNKLGNTSVAFNYKRAGEAALVAMESTLVANIPREMAMEAGSCVDPYASLLQAAALPLEGSYRDTFTDSGWEAKFDVTLGEMTKDVSAPIGTFQFHYLSADCSWRESGFQTFRTDGTGQFWERDEADQCDLNQVEYTWKLNGTQLEQTTTLMRFRPTCDSPWEDRQIVDSTCTLLGTFIGYHYCQIGTGIRAALIRYSQ